MHPPLRRPLTPSRLLLGALALCGAACSPSPADAGLETRRDLFEHAGDARTAMAGRRVLMQDALRTSRFLAVELGEEVVFTDLDLPLSARLGFGLTLIDQGRPLPPRVRVVLRAEDGSGGSAEIVGIRSLAAGSERLDVELPLDAAGELAEPVTRLALSIDEPGGRPSREVAALIRPHAVVPTAAAEGAGDARRVVLVTLDSARADAFGAYGCEDVDTPAFDALAADAVTFRSAFTPSNDALAACASILTARYPTEHGVAASDDRLALAPDDLPGVLRAAGLRSAAFLASRELDAARGELARHFDAVHGCEPHTRSAEDVNADVFAWLDEHRGEDAFLWIHYADPHAPYAAPRPYDQLYVTGQRPPPFTPSPEDPTWLALRKNAPAETLRELYLGEIAWLDVALGELVDRLRALGAYDETLLVLTATHVESLGELGVYSSARGLSDATTRVPLLVKPPASAGVAPRAVEGLVSTLDVFPTLCELLESPVPARSGESLAALVTGDGRSEREAVYSEHARRLQLARRTRDERAVLGLVDATLGREYRSRAGELELYRYADGREGEDEAVDRPEAAARHALELERFRERSARPSGGGGGGASGRAPEDE